MTQVGYTWPSQPPHSHDSHSSVSSLFQDWKVLSHHPFHWAGHLSLSSCTRLCWRARVRFLGGFESDPSFEPAKFAPKDLIILCHSFNFCRRAVDWEYSL